MELINVILIYMEKAGNNPILCSVRRLWALEALEAGCGMLLTLNAYFVKETVWKRVKNRLPLWDSLLSV